MDNALAFAVGLLSAIAMAVLVLWLVWLGVVFWRLWGRVNKWLAVNNGELQAGEYRKWLE